MNQKKDGDLARVTREIPQLMLLVSITVLLKAFYFMLKPGNIAKCCT